MDRKRAARLALQLPPNSRTLRRLLPENEWSWLEILLNKISYGLDVLAWQNANEGVKKGKQSPKPEMYKPPFIKNALRKLSKQESVARSVDDIKELLKKRRKGVK